MSGIQYACVANWETKSLLVESNESGKGSRSVVVEGIIPKLEKPESDGKISCRKFNDDTPVFIYETSYDVGFSVLQVCAAEYSVSLSMQFQEEVANAFNPKYPTDSAAPGFKSELDAIIQKYNTDPPKSKFDAVKNKQDEIKTVLIDNIEALVQRHEQIEITLDQTESLKATSKQFGQSAKKVKQTAQCQQYKTYAIAAAIVVCLLGVLIIIICVMARC